MCVITEIYENKGGGSLWNNIFCYEINKPKEFENVTKTAEKEQQRDKFAAFLSLLKSMFILVNALIVSESMYYFVFW